MQHAVWYKALLLFLWIAPHALLGGVALILHKRGLYREFPIFYAYVLYEMASCALTLALYFMKITKFQYAYAFYATLLCSTVLRFGVIDEVSRDLFRDFDLLKSSARGVLQGVTGLLLLIAVVLAVYAPGPNRAKWYAGAMVITRGAAIVQSGTLLFILLLARFLGVTWRRPTFGIVLGLGIVTSVELIVRAIRAEVSSTIWVPYLDLFTTGTYAVSVSIWIRYLLAPESNPVSVAVLPRDEVATWNTELQHLLKD